MAKLFSNVKRKFLLGLVYVLITIAIFYSIVFTIQPASLFLKKFSQATVTKHQLKESDIKPEKENINSTLASPSSFIAVMNTFLWSLYQESIQAKNFTAIQFYSTRLLQLLMPFILKPPTHPVNQSCSPPVPILPPIKCELLQKPRKVAILWQFGFDMDALEIHLHELYDLVDKFFIIEATQAHSPYTINKPLVWELIKDTSRFANFTEKVVHLIVDDASLAKTNPKENLWSREVQQKELRWQKFLEWNNATNYFSGEDLLGFGDVDEIPNRNNIYHLKSCKLPSDPVDIGIWFPMANINSAYATDFPVEGHEYTLGDPTFWTLERAVRFNLETGNFPTSLKGKSDNFLLGGMHLSRNIYPPHFMAKWLTSTEGTMKHLEEVIEIGKMYMNHSAIEVEKKLSLPKSHWLEKSITLDKLRRTNLTELKAVVQVPWFLECNWGRYPYLKFEHDTKLD